MPGLSSARILMMELQGYGCAASCFVQSGAVTARAAGCNNETNSLIHFEVAASISGNTLTISNARVGLYSTDGGSLGSWVQWVGGNSVKISKVVTI